MELHLFTNRQRKNILLARQILALQRGAAMAFIPDHPSCSNMYKISEHDQEIPQSQTAVYRFKSVGSYKHKLSKIESLVILYLGINCMLIDQNRSVPNLSHSQENQR